MTKSEFRVTIRYDIRYDILFNVDITLSASLQVVHGPNYILKI